MVTLNEKVGQALKTHDFMLATAESCTGGAVAVAMTDLGGSAFWFERGFVTYTNEAKQDMLDVAPDTLERYGAVSEAVVREMVAGALRYSRAQVALSVSGIAGPTGGTPDKPVGTVWFAWGIKDGQCVAQLHHLAGDRAAVRAQSVRIALEGVIEILGKRSQIA